MVPLPIGLLRVERAFLVATDQEVIPIVDVSVEVYEDKKQMRQLRGRGLIHNRSMVESLERHHCFDILLDFGDEIYFWLSSPEIQVGKVFDRMVLSSIHFSIGKSIREISGKEVQEVVSTGISLH